MQIQKLCKSYFKLDYPISVQSALVDFFKIVSYLTIALPILVGLAYQITKIPPERVSENLPPNAARVNAIAQSQIQDGSEVEVNKKEEIVPKEDLEQEAQNVYTFEYNHLLDESDENALRDAGATIQLSNNGQSHKISFSYETYKVNEVFLGNRPGGEKGEYDVMVSAKDGSPVVQMKILNRAISNSCTIELTFFKDEQFV